MLKLQPNPTFRAKVGIPVPGEDKRATVTFVFNHMTRAQFDAFKATTPPPSDHESVMKFVSGWTEGIDAEFSADNLARLLDQYPGAAYAIGEAYGRELFGARLGN